MLLLLAATVQVDDATLRQRESNPEHQEAELRTALRDAVGTDSRDGAWEKAQQDYMRALGGALPHGIPRAGKASDATAAIDEFRFMASTSDADARKLARAETRWEGTDLDDLSPAEIRRFLFVESMRLRVAHVPPEAIEGGERGGERLRSEVSAVGESSSIT